MKYLLLILLLFISACQSVECKKMYDEIEHDLENANYCETDDDCDVLMLGGAYIEFGCAHYINKEVDKQPFYDKMSIYDEKCSEMINDCALVTDSACVAGKCVYMKRDTTEVCAVEYNPMFNASKECINYIERYYTNLDCTYQLGEMWDAPLGACQNCSIVCFQPINK